METDAIKKYYLERLDAMVGLIRELVEIESPSWDEARSRSAVQWVENEFRKTGADIAVERVSLPAIGDHLVIRAFAGDEKPMLLLGHTDTVHPVGTKKDNPTRIDGDKFFGCGIFDMKQYRLDDQGCDITKPASVRTAYHYFARAIKRSGTKPTRIC